MKGAEEGGKRRGVEDRGGGGGREEGWTAKSNSWTSALLGKTELLPGALVSGVAVERNEADSAIVDIFVPSSLSGLSRFFNASVGNIVGFRVIAALYFVDFSGSSIKDL